MERACRANEDEGEDEEEDCEEDEEEEETSASVSLFAVGAIGTSRSKISTQYSTANTCLKVVS